MTKTFEWLPRRLFPKSWRRRLTRIIQPPKVKVGSVEFGDLRRTEPISAEWGFDRGRPIDRYYIEQFLTERRTDIKGRALEIGSAKYTRQFGGERVTDIDVLHVAEQNPEVTIIGDLSDGSNIPANHFDCIILTQTLQTIFDLPRVVETLFRILKPGGVVLATAPGISQISRYDMDNWGYYWSFTSASLQKLFETRFPAAMVQVTSHGNVLSSIAFLHGLAQEELSKEELEYTHPDYQMLITVRAEKPTIR